MYYAFAIVKRVRAALRALRAPRLSELARVHTRPFLHVPAVTRV